MRSESPGVAHGFPVAPAPSIPSQADTRLARYLLPDSAEFSSDGGLRVGGVDLLELAGRFGTPAFIYDEQHLRSRCREAVAAFGPGVAYASKAFLCQAMARVATGAGMNLDVASGGELDVALRAGVRPDKLVMHGNNKSDDELRRAIDLSISRVVVDSFDEIDRLERLTRGAGVATKVLLRVTPGVEAHTHEYVMTGQEDSKFGLSVSSGSAAEAVARLNRLKGVDLVGLHSHIGSQIFRLDSYEASLQILAPLIRSLDLPELCIGGGLGVAYVNGESAPSITDWGKLVRDAAHRLGIPRETVITAEPGRSIAAVAGITLYRVGTIKTSGGGRCFVSVDGGMSDNPRPVLYGSGYEAFLVRAPLAERLLRADVVGKHCESGDFLIKDARLPADISVGDILAVPVTGAYGYSMASNYNRVPRPPVVFVRDGEARVVVRRETVEDLARLESW